MKLKFFFYRCFILAFLFTNFCILLHAQNVAFEWVNVIRTDTVINNAAAARISDHAVDASGNVYITGHITNMNGNGNGNGVIFGEELRAQLTPGGVYGVVSFIAKSDASGKFQWAKVLANAGFFNQNVGQTIGVDETGNIYIAGSFRGGLHIGTTVLVSANADSTSYAASSDKLDIYISKWDKDGNLIWAQSIGGKETEEPKDLSIDQQGNLYLTGIFIDTVDFNSGSGTTELYSVDNSYGDVFLLKLNTSGTFLWVKHAVRAVAPDMVNDDRYTSVSAVDVDKQGHVYITGTFQGKADFDPSADSSFLHATIRYVSGFGGVQGSDNAYISKLDTSGNFVWARNFGTPDYEGYRGDFYTHSSSIATNSSGDVFITGSFRDTVDFDPGSSSSIFHSVNTEKPDAFVLKLNAAGNFQWVKKFGSGTGIDQDGEEGFSITVDKNDNIYYAGRFASSQVDFDPGPDSFYLYPNPGLRGHNYFMSKLDKNGDFVWAKQLASTPSNRHDFISIKVDDRGSVFTVGHAYTKIDYDVSPDPHDTFYGISICYDPYNWGSCYVENVGHAFIHKMSQCDNTYDTLVQTSCDSVILNGVAYTSTGTYTQTLANAGGCDSFVTLRLTITHTTTGILQETVCDSFIFNGKTYANSGTYLDTLPNAVGCDSLLTINLTVNSTTESSVTQTTCKQFTFNDSTYIESGTYIQKLPNALGCDSIITLNLTINKVETGVTQNGNVLTAVAAGGTYQWINCTDNSLVPGANGQSFSPINNGEYAVIVFQNNCIDTSECFSVGTSTINELGNQNKVNIYPNPTPGYVTINTTLALYNASLRLVTLTGKILSTKEKLYGNNIQLDISSYPSGIYFIELYDGSDVARIKLVKQ